jgi:hypothetical protein
MPELFTKPLETIDSADVEGIIGWPEPLLVEYKAELPGRDGRPDPWIDGSKVGQYALDKLFKEVVALANTSGRPPRGRHRRIGRSTSRCCEHQADSTMRRSGRAPRARRTGNRPAHSPVAGPRGCDRTGWRRWRAHLPSASIITDLCDGCWRALSKSKDAYNRPLPRSVDDAIVACPRGA